MHVGYKMLLLLDKIILPAVITLLNGEDFRHGWSDSIQIAPKFLIERYYADYVENLLGVPTMRTR